MSHEEYWDYLDGIMEGVVKKYNPRTTEGWQQMWEFLRLTASPYHYWLENKAAFSPKESSVGKEFVGSGSGAISKSADSPPEPTISPGTEDSSNLAERARIIRKGLYNAYEKDKIYCRGDAWEGLCNLVRTFDDRVDSSKTASIWNVIGVIPDDDLVTWANKHEVFM